jgi:GDP-4-dehydro-6-deoxy-D-mannose reductase
MPTLLTGATGFIGRNILAANPAIIPAPRRWTAETIRATLDQTEPTTIIHAAGLTHAADPETLLAANTYPAATLLAAAAARPTHPRIILIGSAAEYGFVKPADQPVNESHPCAPQTPYAIAKHAQTELGLAARAAGHPILIARLFNAVGPHMPPHLALPAFARRIAQAPPGGTIRTGDLTAARDFIAVAEAVRLLLALAALPNWPDPIINICSGTTHRLADLLAQMIALNATPLHTETDPSLLRPGDMPSLAGSTARLKSWGLTPAPPDFTTILPALLAEARSA